MLEGITVITPSVHFEEAPLFWCLRAQVYLNIEGHNLCRWNQCVMLKIPCARCSGQFLVISVQFAFEMCLTAQCCQKIYKYPCSLFKVIALGAFSSKWKPVYDFLLVINSNLGHVLHHFWYTVTYLLKIVNFFTPSYSALSLRVSSFDFKKKLYASWNWSLPGSRRWRFSDPSLHHFWLIHRCSGWTDRRIELR